ncbi:uncharacterized protein MKZ38_004417 [Zalerion maritima]|uniref:Uncharacterized protein n=1 Tax=Zalerion maritima TaxID=339359 RepID=A0AAD5RLK5_9PEZI|nr:uncharacterized protein MKZ38_004417 [Zalerion maritima]
MVTLSQIQKSNALIPESLPPGTVSVFCGATSGIGEYSLLHFAKYAPSPKIYFLGRSTQSGERIKKECEQLNPEGEYHFISTDLSLLGRVEEVCEVIKGQEDSLNLLFMSQGLFTRSGKYFCEIDTPEGLVTAGAVVYYCKLRFILNLLPLMKKDASASLRRVVIPMTGTKEGKVFQDDWQLRNSRSMLSQRGHVASIVTLTMYRLARENPTVAFVHDFPGSVRSNLAREQGALVRSLAAAWYSTLGKVIGTSEEECGERHVFYATSSRFAPRNADGGNSGVGRTEGMEVAMGVDGEKGSGAYVVDSYSECAREASRNLVMGYVEDGTSDKLWQHAIGELLRVTGKERV